MAATTSALLRFSLTARTVRQRVALAMYAVLSMADHFVRRRWRLSRWGVPHALLQDVTVSTSWGAFHCRKRTSDGWIAGPLFEPSTCAYLKSAIAQGVFVDVGSHIGRHTIEMARHLQNRGQVIALEPHPDTFIALQRNLDLNSVTNVVALNCGCWSSAGMRRLVGTDDLARISDDPAADHHVVRVVTLDELLLDDLRLPRIDLLKLDAEGAEEAVLAGARRVINANPSLAIVFEALDDAALERIAALLGPCGFAIRQLSWKNFVAARAGRRLSETPTVH